MDSLCICLQYTKLQVKSQVSRSSPPILSRTFHASRAGGPHLDFEMWESMEPNRPSPPAMGFPVQNISFRSCILVRSRGKTERNRLKRRWKDQCTHPPYEKAH